MSLFFLLLCFLLPISLLVHHCSDLPPAGSSLLFAADMPSLAVISLSSPDHLKPPDKRKPSLSPDLPLFSQGFPLSYLRHLRGHNASAKLSRGPPLKQLVVSARLICLLPLSPPDLPSISLRNSSVNPRKIRRSLGETMGSFSEDLG
ncbi:hypothetical protein EUTSA_v10003286mg [Eutrema salsugineum]|uniref:Uncharacterized protein n=1 Tax=Eutrema salsugineum TaxID=72664 RepID=V4LQQ8_EUTSA|nr:hypothetical protein EUTSA_v10003286mg [Eutrema salsugineum]